MSMSSFLCQMTSLHQGDQGIGSTLLQFEHIQRSYNFFYCAIEYWSFKII